MRHAIYRQWILQDAPLTPDEQVELHRHLEACVDCRQLQVSWQHVEAELRSAPMVSAPPGFGARFQTSLAERRAVRASRQSWLVLVGSLATGIALLGLMIPLLLSSLPAGAARLINSFISLRIEFDVIRDLAASLLSIVPTPLSSLAGLSLTVAALGLAWAIYASMGALWAAAVYRFAIADNGGTK
jgi:hypothetical protein